MPRSLPARLSPRRLARFGASLVLLTVMLIAASACGGGEAPAAGAPGGGRGAGPGAPVEAVTVTEVPVEQVGEFVGTIRSRNSVTVQPQVEGFLTRIAVKSGDRVAPGGLLFEVDATPQQASLSNLKSIRSARAAEAALARQQAARAKTLLGVGAASQQELELAEAQQATSEAQLRALDDQIKQFEAELAYYRVVAPAAGVIGDVPVRQGDRVTKNTVLTTIDANTGLELYVNIPVQQGSQLRVGLPVRILSDTGDLVTTEKVSFVSSSVDDTNQTVLAKAQITAPAGTFRTEQFVRTQIVFNTAPGLRIPVVAALRINGLYFVYVVDQANGTNVARQTAIQIGPVVQNEYVVRSGLKAGQQVIVSGIQKIGDGAPVTIVPAAAPRQEGR